MLFHFCKKFIQSIHSLLMKKRTAKGKLKSFGFVYLLYQKTIICFSVNLLHQVDSFLIISALVTGFSRTVIVLSFA